jgi:hypothetical protein
MNLRTATNVIKSLNFNSYMANKSFYLCQTLMVKGLTAWYVPNMHYAEQQSKIVLSRLMMSLIPRKFLIKQGKFPGSDYIVKQEDNWTVS